MMFALLRHIGQTSRYEIPPRPSAPGHCLEAAAIALEGRLAKASRHVGSFGKLLKPIHFSVLPAAVLVAVVLRNEQAQDTLRVLREKPGLASVLLVVAAVLYAAVAS
jgi:hypothetical protein